ncbi:MAG: FRG domain-containing protein [Bdellovibrionales bacterium]|nr:FRG domain-containing protein [Bdellovibrionales bacterium]
MEYRHKINSLSQYLEIISKAGKFATKSPLWFRGQRSDKLGLVPGIYRRSNKHLKRDEKSPIIEFFQLSNNFLERENLDGWDWLALMQHYGLPTRLLDWTESSLVALYFALKDGESPQDFPTIWIIDPYALNLKSIDDDNIQLAWGSRLFPWLPESLRIEGAVKHLIEKKPSFNEAGKYPIATYVRYTNPRIIAQSGAFTLHGHYEDCLEKYFESKSIKYRKIVLEPVRSSSLKWLRAKLLFELENVGVHQLSLFPELSSVASFIINRRTP